MNDAILRMEVAAVPCSNRGPSWAAATQPAPQPPEQHLDDDQLEIPAFLRRQAN